MSIDGANVDGQFIQILTIFNYGLAKKSDNLVCTAHQDYKLALNQRGAFQVTMKSAT